MDEIPPPSTPRGLRVVSFVGRSGTGKTSLLERLLPVLKSRGRTVGTLKHHAHPRSVDTPGKDTHRHFQAGSDRVGLVSPSQIAYFERLESEESVGAVADRFFTGIDLVLTEGFKRGPFPKIEVARRETGTELITTPEEGLVAVVSDFPIDLDVPRIPLDDIESLADFLEDGFMNTIDSDAFKVRLLVDGKDVPIKEFVADFLAGSVFGMVKTLKNVPEKPKTLELTLRREEG